MRDGDTIQPLKMVIIMKEAQTWLEKEGTIRTGC